MNVRLIVSLPDYEAARNRYSREWRSRDQG